MHNSMSISLSISISISISSIMTMSVTSTFAAPGEQNQAVMCLAGRRSCEPMRVRTRLGPQAVQAIVTLVSWE